MNDIELELALKQSVKIACDASADGVIYLAEYGARDLHIKAGSTSLFSYLRNEFGFSKNMAWRWSSAARAVSRGVDVAARLRDGRLSICVAAKLADPPELLARADGITLEEAEELIVAVKPRPEKRDVIPAVGFCAEPIAKSSAAPFGFCAEPAASASPTPGFCAEPVTPPPPPKRPEIKPVSAQKSRLHCDVRKETLAKLQRARELQPGKDLDAILEAALDAYLDRIAPERRHERRERRAAKKAAATPRPPRQRKRHLPQATKDAAQVAAGCQCSYVAKSGRRCAERASLEHDHIRPLALGGGDEVENIRPLCRRHHQLKTAESFPGWARVTR